MFVNCEVCGWVTEKPCLKWRPRFARVMLISCDLHGSQGFAHAVKVDVRLVSFPLSGVRNDLASNQDPPPNTASPLPACVHRNYDEIIPSWLRQLPQRFLQFGQPVDFRYGTLQRLHRGSDVLEEMFVTLDQAEKSVST